MTGEVRRPHPRWRAAPDPGPEFLAMVAALRELQEDVASAAPPPEVAARLTRLLEDASAQVGAWTVPERDQLTGRARTPGVLGGSQALIPVVHLDEWDGSTARGQVTFGRFHLGGNGAVHGGVLPLLFDDVLGRLANGRGRPVSRTAYLHVDYRAITPIGRPLEVVARLDRLEGRKRYITGAVRDGGAVCAEAEALFVELRPDQP